MTKRLTLVSGISLIALMASAVAVSALMSIRQPVSRLANRAFWPSRPIARDSW